MPNTKDKEAKEEIKDNEESGTKVYSNLIQIGKHNNFVQGKYHLEASEQKLLYKIFEEIQKKGYTTRSITMSFQDFYTDYKGVLGKNITKKDFKNLIEGVQEKIPYIIRDDEFTRTQWYRIEGKIDYSEVKLTIDEYIFEYVQQSLKENFTSLRLETLYSFKSFYSMRIYELLKQWSKNKSVVKYKLSMLKELLFLESKYEKFSEFNRCVLKKAVKEINEKSELEIIECNSIRKGKQVDVIEFKIKEDKESLKNNFKLDKNVIEINDVLKNNSSYKNNKTNKEELLDEEKINNDDKNELLNKEKINNNDSNESLNKEKINNDEFFIPEELSLDNKLRNLFKRQFKGYNFNETDYYLMALEAESITFSKDDSNKITPLNFKLFVTILENKIKKYEDVKINGKDSADNKNTLTAKEKENAAMMGLTDEEYLDYVRKFDN